jgi:hypothetical protein
MKPNFWKLSQGTQFFKFEDMIRSISEGLVYVHRDTKAKGISNTTQADDFINAPIGDYFYLTNGNSGMYLIGQFIGPVNLFSRYGEGWLERPYKFIFPAITVKPYDGVRKWWSPSDNSTFTRVDNNDLSLFESEILQPHFNISLKSFGIDTNQ